MMLLENLQRGLFSLNNSKFIAGVIMILVNIGGRYVDLRFSQSQEAFMRGSFARELFIFAVAWMSTKDLVTSILLTAAFMILANYLFNEQSSLCVLPARYKNLDKVLDTNKDGIVSSGEIAKAHATLAKADKQDKRNKQVQALNYLASTAM
jgi:hypothetical protein